ncbi:DUF192 domain-containing protein [Salinicola aestuarinus]|uniref:DUF192 domain-containing protein n=1 Tax=Salinicola aestuarinus TaxID=1949082 RepID=UPI000DA138AC|nr:DUF192 domain-containing protein [Salinicola aestuarinus]
MPSLTARRAILIAFVIALSPVWGAALASPASTSSAAADGATQRLTLENDTTSHTLEVEVVDTPAGRAQGLMERDSLPPKAGMLFLYAHEQSGANAFWMYRTRIPLDIAFLGGDGEIRALETMSPCRAASSGECPVYPAGAPFRAALEVNAGYFKAHGVSVGDRVDLSPWIGER